jgi:hypothetical protein
MPANIISFFFFAAAASASGVAGAASALAPFLSSFFYSFAISDSN